MTQYLGNPSEGCKRFSEGVKSPALRPLMKLGMQQASWLRNTEVKQELGICFRSCKVNIDNEKLGWCREKKKKKKMCHTPKEAHMMSLKRRSKFRSVTKKCGSAAPKFFLPKIWRTHTAALRTLDKIKGFSMEPRREARPESTLKNAKTLSCQDTR